ncbi:hypothetical protein GQ43DRAFT_429232 [Delitschia confertaspora ATCC 74209]|uniref:Uncharacterized protein n=1 Tax=Delitschia confertaspora ATCC 74209 TaxID=1513339 RepID=A0A9P4MVI1_9PLEO|nr:hypothetical protein GQ43DRAFT_429232 [Delitschia confertaspora ATCC 74209]
MVELLSGHLGSEIDQEKRVARAEAKVVREKEKAEQAANRAQKQKAQKAAKLLQQCQKIAQKGKKETLKPPRAATKKKKQVDNVLSCYVVPRASRGGVHHAHGHGVGLYHVSVTHNPRGSSGLVLCNNSVVQPRTVILLSDEPNLRWVEFSNLVPIPGRSNLFYGYGFSYTVAHLFCCVLLKRRLKGRL